MARVLLSQGQHERAENPASGKTYDLEIPSHKGRLWKQSLRLPWREENDYPEVEQSFKKLRDAFEAELKAAYDSLPMDESSSLETSFDARRFIAPGVLAERFLVLAKRPRHPELV